MDSDNVIKIDGNLDDLEAEMNQWQQLPFNLRKISDSNCINKYGYTNIQLYNSIKSRLLSYDTNSSNDKPTLSPASIRNGIRLENARNIVSEDKSFNIIDLSDYNRFDNLMIESETKKDLVPIVFNANYSGTYDGHSLKTIITGCTFYNISICFDFKYSDDCGIYYFDKEDNRYALVSNNINHISQINDKAKNSIISVIYVNKDTRNQLKKGCSNYLSRQTGDLTSYGFKANKINELKITDRSQSYSKIFGDFFDAICLISELNTDSLKSNVINKDSKSNNASIYVVYNNSTNRLKLDFKSNIEDINKKINHIYHSFTYDDLYFFKNDANYSKYTMIESNIRYTNGTGNIVSGNNINDAKSSSLINNNNDIADKIEYANNIMSNKIKVNKKGKKS